MPSIERSIISLLAAAPLAGLIMLVGAAPSSAISCPPGHVSVDLGAMGESCAPASAGNNGTGGADYGSGSGSGPGVVTGPPQQTGNTYGPVPGYTPNIPAQPAPAQPAAPVQNQAPTYAQNPAPVAPITQNHSAPQTWSPDASYSVEAPQPAIESPVEVTEEVAPEVEPEVIAETVEEENVEADGASTKKMTKLEKSSEPEVQDAERDETVFWSAAAGAVTLFILVIAYARYFGVERKLDDVEEENIDEDKVE